MLKAFVLCDKITDNAEHERTQHISQRPLERVGNQHIRDLDVGHAVMIAVKLPQEFVVMLEAMHPVLPETGQEKHRGNLHP